MNAAHVTAGNAIRLALDHAFGNDSAMLCLKDAEALYEQGDYYHAAQRALDSLRHSIGILHPDYKLISEEIQGTEAAYEEQSQAYFDRYIAGDR